MPGAAAGGLPGASAPRCVPGSVPSPFTGGWGTERASTCPEVTQPLGWVLHLVASGGRGVHRAAPWPPGDTHSHIPAPPPAGPQLPREQREVAGRGSPPPAGCRRPGSRRPRGRAPSGGRRAQRPGARCPRVRSREGAGGPRAPVFPAQKGSSLLVKPTFCRINTIDRGTEWVHRGRSALPPPAPREQRRSRAGRKWGAVVAAAAGPHPGAGGWRGRRGRTAEAPPLFVRGRRPARGAGCQPRREPPPPEGRGLAPGPPHIQHQTRSAPPAPSSSTGLPGPLHLRGRRPRGQGGAVAGEAQPPEF